MVWEGRLGNQIQAEWEREAEAAPESLTKNLNYDLN